MLASEIAEKIDTEILLPHQKCIVIVADFDEKTVECGSIIDQTDTINLLLNTIEALGLKVLVMEKPLNVSES